MSRDSSRTYLHLHTSCHADLFEDFTRSGPLQPDEIFLPAQYQPLNPEDEDDVVPDMHAAFGIQRATGSAKKDEVWRDLGLEALLKGFKDGVGPAGARSGGGSGVGGGVGGFGNGGGTSDAEGVVGRTLRARRGVEGTSGARLRG